MSEAMEECDRIIDSLPDGWSIWQTATKQVVVQIREGGITENITGSTLSDVLKKADGYKPLPQLKPRPKSFVASQWEPVKAGNKWRPRRRDSAETIECYLKTRIACQESIDRWEQQNKKEQSEWDAGFKSLFPSGAKEGIDFRYYR